MSDPKLDLSKLWGERKETYERWAAKVAFPPKDKMKDECWEWTASLRGGRGGAQYSQFYYDGKNGYGHRYSYEMHHGPIPDNHEVDHKCSNRKCVNPWHLRLLPRRSNRRRVSHRKQVKWHGS